MLRIASQYWALTKPRVVALIVFTAIIGMFLSSPGWPAWPALLLASLGIWLAAGSAAAINHLLDERIDRLMARTAHRPLPSGTLRPRQVLVFAIVLGLASMLLLGFFVNGFTAALTFAALIGYAIVYTGWLKRSTPQNIVIGGLAGAAPPLLGWAAIQGWPAGTGFSALFGPPLHYEHALLLVLIIFVWTPPHFWALAIFRRDDYARAMVPMLPVTHGVTYTRWQILFYTLLLFAASLLPYAAGMSGVFYLGGALVLGAVFLFHAIRLLRTQDEGYPLRVFNYSVVYLMLLFAFLLADHWLLPSAPAALPSPGLELQRIA